MADMKIGDIPGPPSVDEFIQIPTGDGGAVRLGDIINYVAEQALKKVRKEMFRTPEVQIERPFRDPQHRIDAMLEFERMRAWSYKDTAFPVHGYVEEAGLVYCNVRNGVIVWKFAFNGIHAAMEFDRKFDPKHPATTE